jgi:hypothetical protein
LPGENRRERVISETEEEAYLSACAPLLYSLADLYPANRTNIS